MEQSEVVFEGPDDASLVLREQLCSTRLETKPGLNQKTLKSFLELKNWELGLTGGAREISSNEGLGRESFVGEVSKPDQKGELINRTESDSSISLQSTDKSKADTRSSHKTLKSPSQSGGLDEIDRSVILE